MVKSDDGEKDPESLSDTGSVASYNYYGTNIQQISLQAESAEVRIGRILFIAEIFQLLYFQCCSFDYFGSP